jgi:hypothetical protein
VGDWLAGQETHQSWPQAAMRARVQRRMADADTDGPAHGARTRGVFGEGKGATQPVVAGIT